jgi:hypothetical protein
VIKEKHDASLQHSETGPLVLVRFTGPATSPLLFSLCRAGPQVPTPIASELASFPQALHRIAYLISLMLQVAATTIPIVAPGIPRFSSIRLQ